jgi:hypothetical protein
VGLALLAMAVSTGNMIPASASAAPRAVVHAELRLATAPAGLQTSTPTERRAAARAAFEPERPGAAAAAADRSAATRAVAGSLRDRRPDRTVRTDAAADHARPAARARALPQKVTPRVDTVGTVGFSSTAEERAPPQHGA